MYDFEALLRSLPHKAANWKTDYQLRPVLRDGGWDEGRWAGYIAAGIVSERDGGIAALSREDLKEGKFWEGFADGWTSFFYE